MTVLATILLMAITRSDLIERLRTPPVTRADGLVQVIAMCPADMRREYQLPVAAFVADVCETLYMHTGVKRRRFDDPGVVVHLGSVRTNLQDVVVSVDSRRNGDRFMRIRLPAPGYADKNRLRIAAAQAFSLAVLGKEIDDDEAVALLREADPVLRTADERAELAMWRLNGVAESGHSDEFFLKQMRKVMVPGVAAPEDVLLFASRLRLYPALYSEPFCGRYTSLSFDDAIDLAKDDADLRLAAVRKVTEILLFGGGHGDAMTEAVKAYGFFLVELAKGEKSADELRAMLANAERMLKEVGNEDEEDDNRQHD